MYEAFIRKHEDGFLVDCDARVLGDFIFHLKQYKLRSKVTIEDVSPSWSVLAQWNQSNILGIVDKRCDWNMQRTFVNHKETGSTLEAISKDTRIYDMLRMIKGIPEGPQEIPRGKAIPMEYNFDLMNASSLFIFSHRSLPIK